MGISENPDRLLTVGLAGQAMITRVRETGVVIDGNPELELELDVSVDGRPPYAVTHQQVISGLSIPNFQPGTTLAIRVDPDDDGIVMIG